MIMNVYTSDMIEGFKGIAFFVGAGLIMLVVYSLIPNPANKASKKSNGVILGDPEHKNYFFISKTNKIIAMKDAAFFCVENGKMYFKDGTSYKFYEPGKVDIGIKIGSRQHGYVVIATSKEADLKLSKMEKKKIKRYDHYERLGHLYD